MSFWGQSMRRVPRVPALLAGPFRALVSAYDERNVRRLARRLGCSMDEAREVYRLARRDGFGSAHDAVFNGPPPTEHDASTAHGDGRDGRRA